MERRALMISAGLAMLAMYLVHQYLSSEDARLKREYGEFFTMVVATRDILQYETIRPTDIEVVRVPRAMTPVGLIEDAKDVVDAIAAIPISKGEQIIDNKIISKNVYSGLDTQISIGKRAISLPVNVKSSLGFMLRPGNRVDLAAHFEYKNGGTNISEVKVFLQDLLVLASGRTIQANAPRGVDQSIVREVMESKELERKVEPVEVRDTLTHAKTDSNYQTVTLEVTQAQAQIVAYVTTVFADSIVLMLRHSDDRQVDRLTTTNLYDVMGPDSFLVKGNKLPPPRSVPKVRFYDYVGEQAIAVTDGRQD